MTPDQIYQFDAIAGAILSRGGGWCSTAPWQVQRPIPLDDAAHVATIRRAADREARRRQLRGQLDETCQVLAMVIAGHRKILRDAHPDDVSREREYYARRRAELAQHMRDLAAQIGAL
jgi:hypothetical protein